MPIYEYRCKSCGHVFDAFQSMGSDGSDLECPRCQAKSPEKLFSAFASSGNEKSYGGSTSGSAGCGPGGFT